MPVHPGSSNASRPQDIARLCQERGVRFTPLRRIAYEVLLAAGGPASAYDLQRALELRLGRRVSPPTVYRATALVSAVGGARKGLLLCPFCELSLMMGNVHVIGAVAEQ